MVRHVVAQGQWNRKNTAVHSAIRQSIPRISGPSAGFPSSSAPLTASAATGSTISLAGQPRTKASSSATPINRPAIPPMSEFSIKPEIR